MLIEFRVQNHRSLRDEQALTMEAGPLGDRDDPRLRRVGGHTPPLLPVAAIYGANASGKSNVLDALHFLREAVQNSQRFWDPEGGVPRDPFAWSPQRAEPSLFEATFVDQGVRFRYGFVVNDEHVLEEWLLAWPKGKKQVWFARQEQQFRFGTNFPGKNQELARQTRPNALFLSCDSIAGHEKHARARRWFVDSFIRSSLADPQTAGSKSWQAILRARSAALGETGTFVPSYASEHEKASLLALLQLADLDIADVRIVGNGSDRRYDVLHRHEAANHWLPLAQESNGTQRLFDFFIPMSFALATGGILLVDELEKSLHPALAERIVRQFNTSHLNPRNAQLIFTTHDTNLLGSTTGVTELRRDQVWLTEKDAAGATTLYPLTDYKPRQAENLERGYLQGRYGAIPFLTDFSLPRG